MAGRTKKAVKNIAYNMINQVLGLVLTFISRTVFIWGFGIEYLGINGLFADVLGLLSMADLGFNTAMVYSFYKPLADDDSKKIAALISFYKQVYSLIAIAVSFIGVCIIPALPYLINVEKEIPNINIIYLLSLINVVISYLWIYRTSILSADQKGYIITRIGMISNVVRTVLQILSIVLFRNYILYLIIGSIVAVINNIISSQIAVKQYPYILSGECLPKSERRNIFDTIKSVFIYKISSVLLNATDNILISIIISTAAVGYYSNYLMLQNKITQFYALFFTSLTASIGNLVVTEKANKRFEVFECEQSISYIICGVVIPCYVGLVNDFIRIWLGEFYILPDLVVIAIGINMYLSCVLQPLWSYREATGLYRKTKWVMLICATLNLLLSIALGEAMGLSGILFASGLSRLLTYVWVEPWILYRDYFESKPYRYYVQLFGNAALIIALTLFLNLTVGKLISVVSVLTWIYKALLWGGISLIITLLLYCKTRGFRLIIKKISILR